MHALRHFEAEALQASGITPIPLDPTGCIGLTVIPEPPRVMADICAGCSLLDRGPADTRLEPAARLTEDGYSCRNRRSRAHEASMGHEGRDGHPLALGGWPETQDAA